MRISDWSSDVCSSDLGWCEIARGGQAHGAAEPEWNDGLHRALTEGLGAHHDGAAVVLQRARHDLRRRGRAPIDQHDDRQAVGQIAGCGVEALRVVGRAAARGNDLALVYEGVRSEEHTSELQSLMSISYAVFCLK